MDILQNLYGEQTVVPPDNILNDLNARFPDHMNVEWSLRNDHYEALFYSKSTEHIANYSSGGLLVNYKINLLPGSIPGSIKELIGHDREVMNVVKIVSAEGVETFEIIARDKSLSRFLINIGSSGEITGNTPL